MTTESIPQPAPIEVDRLGAAWLNLWGGSSETPPDDHVLLALHDMLTALAAEYDRLTESAS